MENEAELIRQQMLETRTSLSDKLEALQEQVLGTVEGTTKTVTETVQTVQEAVQDTVSTVSESVQSTVDSVKKTFDLSEQVHHHPWLLVGGAVAVGFLGGKLLGGSSARPSAWNGTNGYGYAATGASPPPARPAGPSLPPWLEQVAGPVVKQVQDLALGALVGVAADLLAQHAPDALKPRLDELTNTLTSALGTKPIHGLMSSDGAQRTSS